MECWKLFHFNDFLHLQWNKMIQLEYSFDWTTQDSDKKETSQNKLFEWRKLILINFYTCRFLIHVIEIRWKVNEIFNNKKTTWNIRIMHIMKVNSIDSFQRNRVQFFSTKKGKKVINLFAVPRPSCSFDSVYAICFC